MTLLFCSWVVGACATGSILIWWFDTKLPFHLVDLARWAGCGKPQDVLWPGAGEADDEDFRAWKETSGIPDLLIELSECPGCLSFHVATWVGLVASLLLWSVWGVTWPEIGAFQLAAMFGWPAPALLIQKIYDAQ